MKNETYTVSKLVNFLRHSVSYRIVSYNSTRSRNRQLRISFYPIIHRARALYLQELCPRFEK